MVSDLVEPLKFSDERVLETDLHGFKRSQLVGYRFGSGIDTGEPRYLKEDKFEPIWRYSRWYLPTLKRKLRENFSSNHTVKLLLLKCWG